MSDLSTLTPLSVLSIPFHLVFHLDLPFHPHPITLADLPKSVISRRRNDTGVKAHANTASRMHFATDTDCFIAVISSRGELRTHGKYKIGLTRCLCYRDGVHGPYIRTLCTGILVLVHIKCLHTHILHIEARPVQGCH